jgi:sialate O-acetylesterase
MHMKKFVLGTALVALFSLMATAEVKLPAVIGSGMVLQQQTDVNLWGEAKTGAKVVIAPSWTKQKYTVKADKDGHWKTTVPTVKAGGPYTITFSDGTKQKTVLDNVLLGEVWVCGGQSNMEMPVGGFMYQPVEGGIEASLEAWRYPDIRMFTVPHCTSETPVNDCDTTWRLSTPLTVRTFSAMAYFFGRELQRMLQVPVGIITSNWGGTVIEAWMSRASIDATPRLEPGHEKNRQGPNASTVLYNGMICPIKGFTAKGFIWYQGESNRGAWMDYAELQKSLIRLWRADWSNNDMSFYITQIAPYCYEGPKYRLNALFIDQQYKAADETPHCGVASTTDIGEYGIIHPAKKQPIARRLAWMALANDYGFQGMPSRSPRFKNFEEKDGKLILSFTNLTHPNNYNVSDPAQQDCFVWKQTKGFEVAGPDRKFYPAKANMPWARNTIEVWSDSVPHPVAVRYAYCNWDGDANVVTQTGLPLPSFRSDNWPIDDLYPPKKK